MARFECNVISYVLKRTVDISVVIPTPTIPESMGMGESPHHTPKASYPVLYLMHGMGNGHLQWLGYTKAELYAEEHRIAVVCISAENKAYIKSGSDDFYRFVSEELPDFITGIFPVSKKPEDTYIAGLSMGGYGTLVHALSHPERYGAFGTFSAGIRRSAFARLPVGPGSEEARFMIPETDYVPEFDPVALAESYAGKGCELPKIYMACGTSDGIYKANIRFRDILINDGADVTWDEIDGYGHEWRFWDIELEKFLKWLPRTDVYAADGPRKI